MSSIAVFETGGKQYCVSPNDVVDVELFDGCEEGKEVSFDSVLLVDDGAPQIGTPYVAGKKVMGTVEEVGRHKKIRVTRFRSKSNYRRNYGHRQHFCRVRITKVS